MCFDSCGQPDAITLRKLGVRVCVSHGKSYVSKGYLTEEVNHLQLGYRWLLDHEHPLSDKKGRVLEHRAVMFSILGPGAHACFWCGEMAEWRTGRKVAGVLSLEVDHLDADRTNNDPMNLVPCCNRCQTRKGRQGNHVAAAIEKVA